MKTLSSTEPESPFAQLGIALPELRREKGETIPEPYRGLLVHTGDMTRTLEKFHGKAIHLETLHMVRQPHHLYRRVLLKTPDDTIVELGAIRIHLDLFDGEARQRVLDCRQPLGGILNELRIPYGNHLDGFISIDADSMIRDYLRLTEPTRLYGRQNRLKTPRGNTIAEVVEILPLIAMPST